MFSKFLINSDRSKVSVVNYLACCSINSSTPYPVTSENNVCINKYINLFILLPNSVAASSTFWILETEFLSWSALEVTISVIKGIFENAKALTWIEWRYKMILPEFFYIQAGKVTCTKLSLETCKIFFNALKLQRRSLMLAQPTIIHSLEKSLR